jgi:hypothetical protein
MAPHLKKFTKTHQYNTTNEHKKELSSVASSMYVYNNNNNNNNNKKKPQKMALKFEVIVVVASFLGYRSL